MSSSAAGTSHDLIRVYLDHWQILRRQLVRKTGSLDLAEDALQETWLRLARMKNGPAIIQDRQAYVLRVAANIATDLARRQHRYERRLAGEEELHSVADEQPSPETIVMDRDRLRRLVEALANLASRPRVALIMSRCEGLTHAQIAETLCVSESMVARYLVQALRHCRDHLSDP